MINIRFVTGNDFISNAIRTGERDGWATHAEAVLADGSLLGAHIDGGVQIRPAGYDKATMTRELVVRLEVSANTSLPAETLFYDFLRAQVGKPYDVTAIAGLAFDRNWREDDSWFCSELMAAALETCGYLPALSATDNHISPRDLLLVLSGRIAIPNAA
jgi:uncharacterized protein YycO